MGEASAWRSDLAAAGLNPAQVAGVIAAALAEDLGGGLDVTSEATIPAGHRSAVDLVSRGSGILAGGPVAAAVFDQASGGQCLVTAKLADGGALLPGDVVLSVAGPTRQILTAERTALNLLSHLCGVASATERWVAAVTGTRAQVRDTRKTLPGLRALQKYAVRCGGGVNHRLGLHDAALVKDNHAAAAGGVVAAYLAVRRRWPALPVEVEVDTLEQLGQVLDAGATQVLLDNFGLDQLRQAVAMSAGRAVLEASGGLTLDRAGAVAATGVDYLAVGSLTHSVVALDIGADYRGEV